MAFSCPILWLIVYGLFFFLIYSTSSFEITSTTDVEEKGIFWKALDLPSIRTKRDVHTVSTDTLRYLIPVVVLAVLAALGIIGWILFYLERRKMILKLQAFDEENPPEEKPIEPKRFVILYYELGPSVLLSI
ncbi:hypothetical protein XENTR_v10007190 [Xenopus tropicalis]|nr:hypothetical protein XENTR_v10007190 [Xenopus tropicalis]